MKTLLTMALLLAACVPMGTSRYSQQQAASRPSHPRRAVVVMQQQTCTFSSDCDEGQSCRADASGTEVCMGGGYAGDACWFSSDCLSGSCDDKICR